MSVIVNTNIQALVAQKALSRATDNFNKSMQRLSTGIKINNAVDDSAGLYVVKRLESQLSGSEQCVTNISLATNVLQVAEGDLVSIQNNIIRIKDLATQAASDIYASDSRTALNEEIQQRLAEIDRIATASSFNGFSLLDGNSALQNGLKIQVGAGSEASKNSITITGVFTDSRANVLGLSTGGIFSGDPSVTDASAAAMYIQTCENALNTIIKKRTDTGAAQTRLETASETLSNTIENLSAAKATIMDTDIASEATEYTKQQLLQQVTTSVLIQANQSPSIALQLLQ